MDVCARVISVFKCHKACPLTSASSLAVAAFLEGSLLQKVLGAPAPGQKTVRIGHPSGVMTMYPTIVKENGAFDGFVFCTGIGGTKPFKHANYQSMLQVMDINFFSFIEILRCLSKKGNYNDRLNVVALSSVGGIMPIRSFM